MNNTTNLKVVSEEIQIETTEVEVLGRSIEIILPRTEFVKEYDGIFKHHVNFPLSPCRFKNETSREFNNTLNGKCRNLQENGFRHISLAELVQILSKQSDINDKVYLSIMEALIMSNGYSTQTDKRTTGHWGIYVDDGIRVEDEYATIFKGISGKLKWYEGKTLGPMWNCSYHLKEGSVVQSERFCIKRLFREKLQKTLKQGQHLLLKDIYDANPDLIEYLFEQEFSDLPENIQNIVVNFPVGNKEEKEFEEKRGTFVMPMAMIYQTCMYTEERGRFEDGSSQFYRKTEGFSVKPDMLSMPANYCNSILPVSIHHWGVREIEDKR